jgi:hypothetical protein
MDAIITLVVGLAGLLAMGVLAINFGADSRESIGDDHARPLC